MPLTIVRLFWPEFHFLLVIGFKTWSYMNVETVRHTPTNYGPEDKAIPEAASTFVEKTAFYATLKAQGHSNPSVIWSRIRKLGEELYNAEFGNGGPDAEGEGEGEGEGDSKVADNGKRGPLVRNFDEIAKLIAHNEKLDPTKLDANTLAKIERVTALLKDSLFVLQNW